jgi:diadenosine tetraphosphate (Ap4A) HIT family hydrolase
MQKFELDPRLAADCHLLGRLKLCRVLLMDNALLPWFILVPETDRTEIIDLESDTQALLYGEINLVAAFVERRFAPHKLNIAAIGNIVRQLHVHIVGRYENDYAWPGVVWGRPERSPYAADDVKSIGQGLADSLGGALTTCD